MVPTDHTAPPQDLDSSVAVPAQLPLVLSVVLGLECLIVLHTLTPVIASWRVLVLGALASSATAVLGLQTGKPLRAWQLRFSVATVLGVVVGEAITYFVAVPWELTWICFTRDQHHVATTMFLRVICIGLAAAAWRMTRRAEGAERRRAPHRRTAYAGGVIFGLLTTLPAAFIPALFPVIMGHRPSREVEVEWRAAAQLGPGYDGYRYLIRHIDQVFRRSESVTISASVIAYNGELTDLQDVTVTWKEPWR